MARLGRQLLEVDGTKQLGKRLLKIVDDVTSKYQKFAKNNLSKVSTFTRKDGSPATFKTKKVAEESITRSGHRGEAVSLQIKRGQHQIVMSPAEAQKRGIWTNDNDKQIKLSNDLAEELITKLNRRSVDVPWQLGSAYEKRKRLAVMNIELPVEFRAMLQEYVDLQATPNAPDKIKEMERAMVGREKDGLDFFPTPASLADEMIKTADMTESMSVLEPSAGMGHIAEQIRVAGVEPDVIELSGDRRELLEAKGFNLVETNFLEMKDAQYDRIIMNPPFSDRRDVTHVRHAFSLLKPGGRLVSIMGEGVFFGKDKRAIEFRDWLESVDAYEEKLADNMFMDSSLPVNTGVNSRMVVIDKPVTALFAANVGQSSSKGMPVRVGDRARAIKQKFVTPMAEMMQKEGVASPELSAYVYALHAPERNAHIAEINPTFVEQGIPGSGMSDGEAAMVLDSLSSAKRKSLEKVRMFIDGMKNERLRLLEKYGLEESENIDTWRNQYQYYVPLKGKGDGKNLNQLQIRTGKGLSTTRQVMQALGRRSKADDPVIAAINDLYATAFAAEKAKVGRAIYRLAQLHPNPDVWSIIGEDKKVVMKPHFNAAMGEVEYRRDSRPGDRDDTIKVRINGKWKYVQFKDTGDLLYRAWQRLGSGDLNMALRASAAINRWLSMMFTTYNPGFLVTNPVRDYQTAIAGVIRDTDGGALTGIVDTEKAVVQLTKNVGPAVKGIYNQLQADKDDRKGTSKWEKLYSRYRKAGGQVGFYDMRDLDARKRELVGLIKSSGPGSGAKIRRGLKQLNAYILDLNSALENGSRLAVFEIATSNGLSDDRAAGMARNLTVNFNRNGEFGRAMRALFIFSGPAVQGSAQVFKSMRSKKVQMISGGLMLAGYLATEMARMVMGDDDDTGDERWESIPDWQKERNMVLPDLEGDGYSMIPMAYGYNVFYLVGQAWSDLQHGRDPWEVAKYLTKATITSFMPINLSESDSALNQTAKAVTPTPLLPPTEIMLNEDHFGNPIYKEQHKNAKVKKPLSHQKRTATPEVLLDLTKKLNEATGGNPVVAKGVDISPDIVYHLIKSVFGSVGSTVIRLQRMSDKTDKGEQITANDVPVLRRFRGAITKWDAIDKYNDRIARVRAAAAEYEYNEENAIGVESKQNPLDLALADIEQDADRAERNISKLFKERRQLIDEDADKDEIDAVMDEITLEQTEFLRSYRDAKASVAP